MKNRLRATVLGLAGLVLVGCSNYEVKNHLRGNGMGIVRGSDYPHSLEPIIFNGRGYNVQKGLDLEDSINVRLYPVDTTTRVIDEANGIVSLESSEVYIPFLVRNKQGKEAKGVRLRTDGDYPVRASFPELRTEGVELGAVELEGVDFGIRTIKINTGDKVGEFYAPLVEKSGISNNGKMLNNYLIEKESAKIVIHPDGVVSLRGRLYRPELVNEIEVLLKKAVGKSNQNPGSTEKLEFE